MVCQKIQQELQSQKIPVILQKCQESSLRSVQSAEMLIFACPTYAHGELQVYFQQFLNEVKDAKIPGKKCAVIGLGDPKYDDDYNIESAVILEEWMKDHGGELVCESLKINKSPIPQLDTKVKAWADELVKKIS